MADDADSSKGAGTELEKGLGSRNTPEGRWAKAFRLLLEPFGLWVVQRSLDANKDLPNGFPRIADFITSDPDHLATVYKRFDTLSVRNLLLLEARVAALEAYQRQLDKEDIEIQDTSDNFAVFSTSGSFEYFAYLAYTEGKSKSDPQEAPRSPKLQGTVVPQPYTGKVGKNPPQEALRARNPKDSVILQRRRHGDPHPLEAAAAGGYEELVRLLLRVRNIRNIQDEEAANALQAAAAGGHIMVVRLLLEEGVDINMEDVEGNTAIQAAAAGGYGYIVQVLLEKGANVDASSGTYGTALQVAIENNDENLVRFLLDHNADVNRKDKEGNSAIQLAAVAGSTMMVHILLQYGARVDAGGGRYGTALQTALENKNEDLVRLLLNHKADVNERDKEGDTALQAAIKRNDEDLVRLLIEHGAYVNAEDKEGKSPLQAAAAAGYENIVQILLENGADTGGGSKTYWDMVEAAIRGGYENVARLLLTADKNRGSGDHSNRLQPDVLRSSEPLLMPPLVDSENYEKFRARTFRSQTDIPECALEEWGKQRWKDASRWERDPSKKSREEQPDDYFRKRWDVALAIQKALKEYQEALLLHAKVLKLSTPTERTTNALKGWIGKAKREEGTVKRLPLQFRDTSAAFHLLDDEKDLISLHPPGDDDNGTKLVARIFDFWLRIQRKLEPNVEGETVTKYSAVPEIGIRRFTTIWTFYVAIGFLMGAVWLIRRIGLDETSTQTKFLRELVVMTVFTAVFGAWVALMTSARRAEIFGATAAYAAVLIVFVGTNPITPS